MKRYILKITLITLLMSMVLYMTSCSVEKNIIIDMQGSNDLWNAYLNVNTGYTYSLMVTLVAEEFDPPTEIGVDVLVKEKSVYSDIIKIKEEDYPHFGVYESRFDSVKYLEKNYENVSVVVDFDDETIAIPLNLIEIID